MRFSPEHQGWQQARFQTTANWTCDGNFSPQPTERESRTTRQLTSTSCWAASLVSLHLTQLDVSRDNGRQNHRSLLMALVNSMITHSHSHINIQWDPTDAHATHRHVIPPRCMAWLGACFRDPWQLWTHRRSSIWLHNWCRGQNIGEDATRGYVLIKCVSCV